jgi:signal transduction histidine kinase/ActR/RegA family two-component response regulator
VKLFPAKSEQKGAHFEKDGLILFHDVMVKGETVGSREAIGTLYLKEDLLERDERIQRYAAIALAFMIVSVLLTYLLSVLLQRVISKPIFELADAARAISSKKNYSVRAVKHGNDELGQLIDGFNGMLGQIQQRDAALQESHDQLEKRVEERTRDLREEITERLRAQAGLQQQFARLSLLNQITHSISDRQDTDSILHVVLRQLEDHMGLDMGMATLFDTNASMLNVAALRVKNSSLAKAFDVHEGGVLKLADSGLEQCEAGRTVYLADTLKMPSTLAEKLAGTGWRSAVAVPLMVEDKLFGVLIAARLQPEAFTSGDSEFLRMLSEHVALAAHQDRLHRDLERAYNELRQTQATVMQQERLKALGQMASGIAHDVNNALSPVVGFSDLILRGEYGLNESGKKFLKHIRTAGEDIAHIVSRLREFYRRRDDTERMQKLDLNALTEQVVDMTRPRWRDIPQSNGITIEVQTDLANEVPSLVGIESEVREAMTNLVINAVDALPSGGRVTLRTHVVTAGGMPQVQVDVSDNGIGMSEETRKRCLEPFYSTKGKRGTGLGLAMVYGVMQRHEGNIEILSELGKGTTFRLIFPVRRGLSHEDEDTQKVMPVTPMQILCIDDEPLLRDLIKEILERDGHAVETSDGGQSGIEAFRLAQNEGRPFDVVITDLGMPYVDGKQVAKTLKHESPGTPVVMLTGWGAFMKEEGAPAQVDGILSKPPRSKELRETLSRVSLGRKATRQSSLLSNYSKS